MYTESASDFAYNNQLLFNEVSCLNSNQTNVDLVVKTLRTRAARLVNEMGTNLGNILNNLMPSIQIKQAYDDSEDDDEIEDLNQIVNLS